MTRNVIDNDKARAIKDGMAQAVASSLKETVDEIVAQYPPNKQQAVRNELGAIGIGALKTVIDSQLGAYLDLLSHTPENVGHVLAYQIGSEMAQDSMATIIQAAVRGERGSDTDTRPSPSMN